MTGPRVRPLAPEDATPEVRPIFETYMKERGNIPNMFRTVAVRPKHLQTMIAHFRTVMNEGTVPEAGWRAALAYADVLVNLAFPLTTK